MLGEILSGRREKDPLGVNAGEEVRWLELCASANSKVTWHIFGDEKVWI